LLCVVFALCSICFVWVNGLSGRNKQRKTKTRWDIFGGVEVLCVHDVTRTGCVGGEVGIVVHHAFPRSGRRAGCFVDCGRVFVFGFATVVAGRAELSSGGGLSFFKSWSCADVGFHVICPLGLDGLEIMQSCTVTDYPTMHTASHTKLS
jgi:hypothetical protein